jgi:hypothetical protein
MARIASRCVGTGARIYTDFFPPHNILQSIGYRHDYVNHSLGKMLGEMYINNCENKISILRKWLSLHRDIQGQPKHIAKPIPTTEKHKQTWRRSK